MTAPQLRHMSTWQRIALLALALLLGLPLGCGGESATILLHYPGQKDTPPAGVTFNEIKFELVSNDADADANWNKSAPIWTNDKKEALPSINCPVDDNGWTGYLPAPGAPKALSPYLRVFTNGGSGNQLEGRFPLHVACSRPGFSISLAQPWLLSQWRPTEEGKSKLARIGHRVTRIADGRYVISGGTKKLIFGGTETPLKVSETSSELIIYDPTTGELTIAKDDRFKRAFHSAEWNRGRILLTGGITETGFAKSYLVFFTGKTEIPAEELTELACDGSPVTAENGEIICLQEWPKPGEDVPSLAFQRTLRVPKGENTQDSTTIQLGGISANDSKRLTTGAHSLFHTATYLPGKRSILVTGGFYYDAKSTSFRATNFYYELQLDDNNQFVGTTKVNFIKDMAARAGHTATRLDDDNVLLVGGAFGAIGEKHSSADAFGGHIQAELLTYDKAGKVWVSNKLPIGPNPKLTHRAFHSATRILDATGNVAQIHITGGVTWTLGDKGKVAVEFDAPSFIFEATKADQGFTFKMLTAGDNKNEEPNKSALQSATTFETGLLLYLGGAQDAIHEQIPNKQNPALIDGSLLTFTVSSGPSLFLMPGKSAPAPGPEPPVAP